MVGPTPGQWQRCPAALGLACEAHSSLADIPERFLEMFIYIVFFYWKTYAYSIDIVFEVVKEFLYAVFFGFTKPIKRPSETNLADNLPFIVQHTPAASSRHSDLSREGSLRSRSASPAE